MTVWTHLDYAAGLHTARPGARTKAAMCGALVPTQQVDNLSPTCPGCREYFRRAHLDDMRALVRNLETTNQER